MSSVTHNSRKKQTSLQLLRFCAMNFPYAHTPIVIRSSILKRYIISSRLLLTGTVTQEKKEYAYTSTACWCQRQNIRDTIQCYSSTNIYETILGIRRWLQHWAWSPHYSHFHCQTTRPSSFWYRILFRYRYLKEYLILHYSISFPSDSPSNSVVWTLF